MKDFDIEYSLGLPILESLNLPVSESNCRRALKAIDIEANRLPASSVFETDELTIASVQSDREADVVYAVSVNVSEMIADCECEDFRRHAEMAETFGDENRHFCKHAMAVLLRIRSQLPEPKAVYRQPVVVSFPNSGREVTYS